MSPARHAIAVASGKGGVGKSTVALNLALAFRDEGARVGVLDADFYGPDIPLMVNLKRETTLERWDFWRGGDVRLAPVEQYGLKLMSVGFLLGERQALTMAAPLLGAALRQLVQQVDWRSLDVLLIDLPPERIEVRKLVWPNEFLRFVSARLGMTIAEPEPLRAIVWALAPFVMRHDNPAEMDGMRAASFGAIPGVKPGTEATARPPTPAKEEVEAGK